MDSSQKNIVISVATILLSIASFFVCLYSFNQQENKYSNISTATVEKDTLSGEEYGTGGINNYREVNPYGSYFVGFENISDSGIANSDMIYIHDVITNFVMYHEGVYNGKVSYVKDSLKKQGVNKDNSELYQFKFGVNDSNIHTMKVESNWLDNQIKIAIVDSSKSKVFDKSFRVYAL